MSRWRENGRLDDPIQPNGDGGFYGFETRRHPTLLEAGVARFAENMRFIDFVGNVRKGIDRITEDVDTPKTAFTIPFDLGGQLSIASITRSGSTATVTLSAAPDPELADGDEIEIQGANESDYNGAFSPITKISSTVFTYDLGGATPTTPATGTITCSQPLGVDQGGVFASCRFSDVETNNEYIAIAQSDKVTLVDPDNPTETIDIEYANDTSAFIQEDFTDEDDGDITQVGNGLLINRGTKKKALEWDGNIFNSGEVTVESITRVDAVATVTTDEPHEYTTNDKVSISGSDQSEYNGDFIITVTTENTFTYAVDGTPVSPATGSILVERKPQFKPIKNTEFKGFLNMPKAEFSEYHPFARLAIPIRVIDYDIKNLSGSGNVATATTSLSHGLQIGDRIEVSGASDVNYNGVFVISTVDSDTEFSYIAPGISAGSTGGASKKVTLNVRDMFILSDIYDQYTYDPVNNIFRINRGRDDRLVSLKTWQNDNLIALYEKSIHVITGISLPTLQNSEVWKITDEVGCIARKTVQIIGEHIVFLSNKGVEMLQITPQLNLTGRDIPMSEDINDQFTPDNLNYEKIGGSVAIYFDNRYYIALPSNGSDRNDIVYIYNFINKKWESKDTFGSDNFIDNWVICQKGGKDRLFATSVEGSIQLYEELEFDELGSVPTPVQIYGNLITRRYTMGVATNTVNVNPFSPLESNRFVRGSANITAKNGEQMTVRVNTEDPDSTALLATYAFTQDGNTHKRFRINKRGTGAEIQLETQQGRPSIRSVSVDGTEYQRANKNFE